MTDPLVELLRCDECRALLSRLRKKLQRGELLSGRCRFTQLDRSQATCISKLTGVRTVGEKLTIDLDAFAQVVIRTGRFDSLKSLVQIACGEDIEDLRAMRVMDSAHWQQIWDHAEQLVDYFERFRTIQRTDGHVGCEASEEAFTADSVRSNISAIRRTGWLRRLTSRNATTAKLLLDQAFSMLDLLPTNPVPLPVFAAQNLGSAHALDGNTNLGRLLFKLLSNGKLNPTKQRKSVTRRRIWESVGIVTDELSSSALALNLPVMGNALTDRLLQDHAQQGVPARLTFRHLRLHPPTLSLPAKNGSSLIYVCENPSVLAEAANQIGSKCPPMICVEGHPSLTCWILLQMLAQSGYRLAYHGDFDWGGIRIANKIFAAFGFKPWRFTASAHQICSEHHRKLRPPESEALWDSSLSNVIRQSGVSVEEESVINDLLADLQVIASPQS